jgi:hypothetical protein
MLGLDGSLSAASDEFNSLAQRQRIESTLHRFLNDDDERRREIDRLLESLDAASATPQPVSA